MVEESLKLGSKHRMEHSTSRNLRNTDLDGQETTKSLMASIGIHPETSSTQATKAMAQVSSLTDSKLKFIKNLLDTVDQAIAASHQLG